MPDGITTDQLNIVIKVDSTGAEQGIERVKAALEELRGIAESRNLTNLKDLASTFTDFSNAAKSLYSVAFSGISAGISNLVDSLSRIDHGSFAENARKTGDALKELARPAELFTAHAEGLGKAADGLSKLGNALATWGDGVDVEQIKRMKDPLDELGRTVRGVAKTGNNLNQLKNGLSGLQKAVSEFSLSNGEIAGLGPVFTNLAFHVDRFSESSQKGASAIYRIANAMRNLNEVGFSANLADNMRDAAEAFALFVQQTVDSIPDDVIKKFIKLGDAVQHVVKIRAAQKAVNVWSSSLSRAGHSTSGFAKVLKSIGSTMLSAIVAPFKFAVSAVSSLVGNFKRLDSIVSRAITSLKKLASNMLRGAFNLAISPIKGGINAVNRFGEAFKKLGSTIQRLVLYRFLRSMIRAIVQQTKLGIDALYNWSDVVGYRFKAAMDGLATSFQYLRNSIAAMISPLVEYLQPIIDVLIDKFVELLNVVNQFIAKMTGKNTYVRAIKGAAKYAEETGYAAAAQEELNRTILGFDELNKLNDTNDRGHGSPTANAGGGEFEELPITESFNKMKIDFGDLGKKISDALADALESIKWPAIQKKVNSVVQKVVDFFNGFFGNKNLWLAVGDTIGNGMNTMTGALLTFTDGVEWREIGSNIAAGVRNAIGTIDWKELGRSAVAIFKSARKIFEGFREAMTPADWKALIDGIAEAVQSALAEFDIDWATVKTKAKGVISRVTEIFSDFFGDNTLWSRVGNSIGKGINFVTTTILTLTSKIDWVDIGNDIRDAFMGAVQTINWENLGKTAVSGLKAMLKLFHGFIKSMSQSDWADFGKRVGQGITAAINDINWGEFIFDMIHFAVGILTAIMNAFDEIDFSGVLINFFKEAGKAVYEFFHNFDQHIADLYEILRPLFKVILPDYVDTMDRAVASIKASTASGASANKKSTDQIVSDAKRTIDKLVEVGKISQDEADTFSRALNSGSAASKEAMADMIERLGKDAGVLSETFRRHSQTSAKSLPAALRESAPEASNSASFVRDKVVAEFKKLVDDSWWHGYDATKEFASGLSSYSSLDKVASASRKVAATARSYLAFSKPDLGPLSDADKYGPDFMKLYAQGIENSKYLVQNAVKGLASDVNGTLDMQNTYTLNNEPTGLDSLAQAITNSDTPINVYIGNDKLDTVIARSNGRLNYRSGGKF